MRRTAVTCLASSILGCLLTLGALAVLSPARADAQTGILTGTALELKDNAGLTRLRIAQGTNGAYTANFVDASGHQRGVLGTDASGEPIFGMLDAQGHARINVAVLNDGTSAVVLKDMNDVTRAAMAVAADGSSGMATYDGGGNPTGSIP